MSINYLNRFYPLQQLKLLTKAVLNTNNNKKLPSPLVNVKCPPLPTDKAPNAVKSILTCIDNQSLDFTVSRRLSSIPNSGYGVYLNGAKEKGSILCFYPGTIYMISEPIFFVSIANQYILKCVDGIYIDGKSNGLSAYVYKSCYQRENWPGAIQISDWTWLLNNDTKLINPLAVGQYVNNATSMYTANVCYQEVDLVPVNFPNKLRKYIPNIYWDTHINPLSSPMRVVALVALRDIQNGEELFSTYMDLVE